MFVECLIQRLVFVKRNVCLKMSCGSHKDGLITNNAHFSTVFLDLIEFSFFCCCFFCIVTHSIQQADAGWSSHNVCLNALLCDYAHASTRLCLVASGASHWDNMLHN